MQFSRKTKILLVVVILIIGLSLVGYKAYFYFLAYPNVFKERIDTNNVPQYIELNDELDSVIIDKLVTSMDSEPLPKSERAFNNEDSIRVLFSSLKPYYEAGESQAVELTGNQLDYAKILASYETGDKKNLLFQIEKKFNVKTGNREISLKRYVVAACYGLGEFEKAIQLLLELEQADEEYDYWFDYALCSRKLAMKKSREYAADFIAGLLKEQQSKSLSVLLPYISTDISSRINLGIHSLITIKRELLRIEKKRIAVLMKRYPDDPLIEQGHYLLGDYEKALSHSTHPKRRIVFLYAAAHHIGRKYSPNYTGLLEKSKRSASILAEISRAREYLREYFQIWEESPVLTEQYNYQWNDAAYWMGWAEGNLGNYSAAIKWLDNSMENHDFDGYFDISSELKEKILYCMPLDSALAIYNPITRFAMIAPSLAQKAPSFIIQFVAEILNKEYSSRDSLQRLDLAHFLELIPSDQLQLLPDKISSEKLKDQVCLAIADRYSEEFRIEEAESLLSRVRNRDLIKKAKESCHCSRTFYASLRKQALESFTLSQFIETIKKLKYYELEPEGCPKNCYYSQSFTLDLINEGIAKFDDKDQVAYLYYLKIRLLKEGIHHGPVIQLIEETVMEMTKKFPSSKYTDDALCELASTQLLDQKNFQRGERTVLKILNEYPNSNACDNALNLVAVASNFHEEKFLFYNNLLLKKFPKTRFAKYAKIRLKYYKRGNENRGRNEYEYYHPKGDPQNHIIIGSFSKDENAASILFNLRKNGFLNSKIVPYKDKFLISLFSFQTLTGAKDFLKGLSKKTNQEAWILTY